MLFRHFTILGYFLVCFLLLSEISWAEEAPAPEPLQAAEVVAPEPPAVLPPELKPITITFAGTLDAVKSTLTPPAILVQDRYGVKKEISVPQETEITDGAQARQFSDLSSGGKLTVEYSYDVATGKRTAQSILIGNGTN